MKNNLLLALLALLASFGSFQPAAAQTGRLDHLSHGGSPATLAAAERKDNFGIPPNVHKYERITRLNDSMMLVEGRERDYAGRRPWQPFKWQQQYRWARPPAYGYGAQPLNLRQQYPAAQIIGFDSTTLRPTHRKKAVFAPAIPTEPTPTGGALLLLVALAGAGWALGCRPRLAVSYPFRLSGL